MFKCSFVLPRLYFLCFVSCAFVMFLFCFCVNLFAFVIYVYSAFVQNQHGVYCFCIKSMLVFYAFLFYGFFPTIFKCVINFDMFVYVTRHAYLIFVCPTIRIALQIVISKVKLGPQPVLPTLCLHPSTTL